MGSFNETCALSNMDIPYGEEVRLLFLSRNPHQNSDQQVADRGVCHYSQWFVRTPPIKGKYNDYGQCEFKKGPITKLIEECFTKDVVEKPFGFNSFHTHAVKKKESIDHYLKAAWQGRLEVLSGVGFRRMPKEPEQFPTWQKVEDILKKARMPIQSEKRTENAFNAQPVAPGIVCITYESFGNTTKQLEQARKEIVNKYDCQLVYKFPNRKDDGCLLVMPKNGFNDYSNFINSDELDRLLTTHPEHDWMVQQIPVMAVMIREDVWQLHCEIGDDEIHSVDMTYEAMKKKFNKARENINHWPPSAADELFREYMVSLPFDTTALTHVSEVINNPKFNAVDELLQSCAELSHVEQVMAHTAQSWHIPQLGHQWGNWPLYSKLFSGLLEITKKQETKEDE